MMTLKDIVNEKWKDAFKMRDLEKRTAYELIKQRIMVAEKSGQVELPLSDEYITNLIIKEVKEREDILTFYSPEDEQYKTAKAVIDELSQYLPKAMSEDEVIAIIKRIKETEPNLGKVIGLTVKEVGNRFDKSKIAALVKQGIKMEIVYFELNNWFPERDYPAAEPFLSWMTSPYGGIFAETDWCIKNKLCVVQTLIDMSVNYCITATKEWVETNCPELLTKYTQFLRFPDSRYDNEVYGQFGSTFKEWSEENFGCEFVEEE